jgi:hypothetical protein
MKQDIPTWARQPVTPEEHDVASIQRAYDQGSAQIQLPDGKALKEWARSHGWPTPWFGFQAAFIAKMFENQESFGLALRESGLQIFIPIREHTLSIERLKELDALYAERSSSGQPVGWGSLVEQLRAIRRLVEAGIKVKIEGTEIVLATWSNFYEWAHGRYHMLEDGYDHWIGDDDS